MDYLKDGKLPKDKLKRKNIICKSAKFTLLVGILYKKGFSAPYLRFLKGEEVGYVIREIHKGICGNHFGERALTHKIIR